MQIDAFKQSAVKVVAQSVLVKKVLADIETARAGMFRIPAASINQDDLYVYNGDTLQLLWQLGATSELGRAIKQGRYLVPSGCVFSTGMSCRDVGIWCDK